MRTQMNHKQERDIERRIQEIHQKANERLLTLVNITPISLHHDCTMATYGQSIG